jgi:hypothetical protein
MFSKTFTLPAALALVLMAVAGANAQDAMSSDAMAGDAMAPMMSDDELAQCVDEAKAISFPAVAMVAEEACHTVHNGQDAMGGDGMMGGDAMAPAQ